MYNDLYILDVRSWEWSYVGEAGEEIVERNSHSLDIVDFGSSLGRCLVLFGGASPERGPMQDTYYARLSDTIEEIESETKDFFVEWKKLDSSGNDALPSVREMHGSCVVQDAL